MNVFSPDDTTHTLKIIPRFYPVGSVTVSIKDEADKEVFTTSGMPTITDGYLYFDITKTFENKSNHQIQITGQDEVVYRGKIFVTDQADDTQAYKISKDVFTYE